MINTLPVRQRVIRHGMEQYQQWLYIADIGDGLIKLGQTNNPAMRQQALRITYQRDAVMLAVFGLPDSAWSGFQTENTAHRLLRIYRVLYTAHGRNSREVFAVPVHTAVATLIGLGCEMVWKKTD